MNAIQPPLVSRIVNQALNQAAGQASGQVSQPPMIQTPGMQPPAVSPAIQPVSQTGPPAALPGQPALPPAALSPSGLLYLAPVNLELYGSLEDVLLRRGYLEVIDERPVWRRIQYVRFSCGEPRLARLVRVELETPHGKRSFTPANASECLNLVFDVPPEDRITARLTRGRHVDPLALDEPFPAVYVALEVLG